MARFNTRYVDPHLIEAARISNNTLQVKVERSRWYLSHVESELLLCAYMYYGTLWATWRQVVFADQ